MATKDTIDETLKAFEAKMSNKAEQLSMAEYIKLLQISQELADDEPKEIKVEWVEAPKSTEA